MRGDVVEMVFGNEYRSTVVCVDSYENCVFSGRLYNPFCPEGKQFHSLIEFFVEMENMLDEMHFPQSFTNHRTFFDADTFCLTAANKPHSEVGACGTFFVRVLFRQNSSWQGSVLWKEGKRETSFRSALELALLFDDALRSSKKQEGAAR